MSQNSQVAPQGAGAGGGPGNGTSAVEDLLKYKDAVKQALLNAIKKAHSCVLRYSDIYDSVAGEDVWSVLDAFYDALAVNDVIRIDDVVVHDILYDDKSRDGIIVTLVGEQLTARQVTILREIAELLTARKYEGRCYDATHGRVEVYTVIHNLVNKWTDCRSVIQQLEEDEEEP